MMTSFSFEPLLRGLSVPKSVPAPARFSTTAELDPAGSGEVKYRASLFDMSGTGRIHCWGDSPEAAARAALLGYLAAVAAISKVDVAEMQARVVRMTLN